MEDFSGSPLIKKASNSLQRMWKNYLIETGVGGKLENWPGKIEESLLLERDG